jgi:putative ABC transport system substrate-binding protein
VFVNVSDPVAQGLVATLARPGGNATGLTNLTAILPVKQFDLLLTMLPKLTRMATLSNPSNQISAGLLSTLEPPAEKRGVRLIKVEARSSAEFESAFASMTQQRAEALMVLPDPVIFQNRRQIIDLAAKSRLPAIYPESGFTDAGALMSYGANFDSLYRQAGRYVDRILKGAKPAELAVEQPSVLELVINRKAAKSLGVVFPREVLVAADKVIE